MRAVIQTGGKQYLVQKGDTIRVEKMEEKDGGTIQIKDVMMIVDGKSTKVGTPLVSGAVVSAKVVTTGKGDKVRVYKQKQRKRYRRNLGHRQTYTEVEITDVKA